MNIHLQHYSGIKTQLAVFIFNRKRFHREREIELDRDREGERDRERGRQRERNGMIKRDEWMTFKLFYALS